MAAIDVDISYYWMYILYRCSGRPRGDILLSVFKLDLHCSFSVKIVVFIKL